MRRRRKFRDHWELNPRAQRVNLYLISSRHSRGKFREGAARTNFASVQPWFQQELRQAKQRANFSCTAANNSTLQTLSTPHSLTDYRKKGHADASPFQLFSGDDLTPDTFVSTGLHPHPAGLSDSFPCLRIHCPQCRRRSQGIPSQPPAWAVLSLRSCRQH